MHALLAVYGTLRRDGRLHPHLRTVDGRARYAGTALVPGVLHEVAPDRRDNQVLDTSYPCLTIPGDGDGDGDGGDHVVVELYEIVDPSLLDSLDELEGYDPTDLAASEYHRVLVTPTRVAPAALDGREAWIYVYVAASPDPALRIPGGDWIRHVDERHTTSYPNG